MNQHCEFKNTGSIQNTLDMSLETEKESHRKERSITQAFSNLGDFFYSPIINVST